MELIREVFRTNEGELLTVMLSRSQDGCYRFRIDRNNFVIYSADFFDRIIHDEPIVNYDEQELKRKEVELIRLAKEITDKF